MFDILDLPKYLSEHNNKESHVFIACTFDKQVEMPAYLQCLGDNKGLYAVSVNILGVAFGSENFQECEKYIVKGKAVVVLGPSSFAPTSYGERIYCLYGDAILREPENNYIEVLMAYGNKLYATAKKSFEIKDMRENYVEFGRMFDDLGQKQWDLDKFFEPYNFPNDYRVCGSGKDFSEIDRSKKFIYQSEEDYKKANLKYNYNLSNNFYEESKLKNDVVKSSIIRNRKDILEKPYIFYTVKKSVEEAKNKINLQIKELSKMHISVSIDNLLDDLFHLLTGNWKFAPMQDSMSGRMLFKTVIEYVYPEFKNKYENNMPLIDYAIDYQNLLNIWYTGVVPKNLSDNVFYRVISNSQEEIYIGFIDFLLGLKKRLVEAYNYSKVLDLDVLNILYTNPYYLSLVDNRLSIENMDRLAMLYHIDMKDREVQKIRNAAYLHHIMNNTNYVAIGESTLILKNILLENIFNGYVISSKSYTNLNKHGMILTEKAFNNLKSYIKSDITISDFSLPLNDRWKAKKINGVDKYLLEINTSADELSILNHYLNLGIGIQINIDNKEYIMDYNYAFKEIYIIDRLYELQMQGEKFSINDIELNRCIRGFERLKAIEWDLPNFKLEEKQIEAVKLLYNPVMCLTGPAGSGKTTTAEAILFTLQALFGYKEDEILFCAPTALGAKRLKDVVKKPTRTINSLFGVGNECYTLVNDEDIKKKSDIKVLIIDECSMVNIDLMFSMFRKISDGTRIIFMGDKEQLPPIGAGKPFANILEFLPCVCLEVTKRASANSGITQNAEKIILKSDSEIMEDLEQFDDFRILETEKKDIPILVAGIVNYHLGRAGSKRQPGTSAGNRVLQSVDVNLIPDDIQVVTPVNKYEWGTQNLNKVLQDVMNPVLVNNRRIRIDKGKFATDKDVLEYRINDRVVHTENMPTMERYIYKGINTYQKLKDSQGIMNGEIGKIVEFVLGSELKFIDNDGNEDEVTKKKMSDSEDVLYVAVKYEDISIQGDVSEFIIFYKTEIIKDAETERLIFSQNIYTIYSFEIEKLNLAYALTVHKMQGSQAKLVIFIVYPVGYSSFISRNLLYTGITRAQQGIYFIGNVWKYGNVVNRGRKIEENSQRLTITDKIYEQ